MADGTESRHSNKHMLFILIRNEENDLKKKKRNKIKRIL